MTVRPRRRALAALTGAAAVLAVQLAGAAPASAAVPPPLPPSTRFAVEPPSDGAASQIADLVKQHRLKDALLVTKEVATPQAAWFTGGSAAEVRADVQRTVRRAALQKAVPTLVVYNAPGRDCSQYSSGGAPSDVAYRSWIDGVAAGIGTSRAIVIVEPDGLANLPSDCPSVYPDPGTYPDPAPGTATAGRIADVKYAGSAIQRADPKALVYLDAGHSAWHGLSETDGTSIVQRLQDAGVDDVRGFSLNTSNYQWTPNLSQYGTWISDCLAYTSKVERGDYASCGDQYWSGGPSNGFQGVALDPAKQWSATATDATANTAGITSRYAALLGDAKATAGFVLDTSRNGTGPWAPTAGTYTGDPQTWCNPPARGLGAKPKASPQPTAYPLLDAYLWVKTPGQSDGQCDRGVAGGTTDPEWDGITDPAAGAWFPQQALDLAERAVPRP